MEKSRFGKRAGTAGGSMIRRIVIFLLVAGAAGGGLFLLFRQGDSPAEKTPPSPAEEVRQPELPAPVPEQEPVEEEKTLEISPASKNTPAPAEDPETAPPKTPEPAPVVKQEQEPVRKGIPHPTDPADEEPYSAPDLIPAGEFSGRLAAIRSAAAPEQQLAELRKLLKETAFASPQYREAAKLLNNCTRNFRTGSTKYTEYTVRPGDGLIRLARKFHLPTSRLAAENGLKTDASLQIGQKLRVPESVEWWSVRISKRARLLRLYQGKELFAVYDVGIGRRDRTPEGQFILRETVENPPYPLPGGGMAQPGSPENQLGPCWLGLGDSRLRSTGYGIHGTPDETSVTRSLSAGCVRMRNKEVLELRSWIPVGTPVVIEN